VERLDDALGELAGHVVDHNQLTVHVLSRDAATFGRRCPDS
jgi:hypothetical protein